MLKADHRLHNSSHKQCSGLDADYQMNHQKEINMSHAGKKDKGKKEQKKKSKHTLKEKRKLKHEKHENTEKKHLVIPS
jgi:lipocalin